MLIILFEVFHNDIICKKGNSNSNSLFLSASIKYYFDTAPFKYE